ncbi:hypothetical protein MSAN_01375500 [Mycena sanguinolenta]|uniref:Uncharacterized protein n=1 Tax=Mycena sanguinolenta TaxID=230812 RepID=A0A8H6YA38_9AGAR|nr:hypothetical protein MSAN_01375500 [Mycena sanguinolenta]
MVQPSFSPKYGEQLAPSNHHRVRRNGAGLPFTAVSSIKKRNIFPTVGTNKVELRHIPLDSAQRMDHLEPNLDICQQVAHITPFPLNISRYRSFFHRPIHAHYMATPLDSTYGVWLVSLFLETILYGMGVLQTWSYFAALPTDIASVKGTVLVVLTLETVQVIFFFRSSYFRFVERFGQIQLDLIW